MEKYFVSAAKITLLLWIAYSCKKEYDHPPLKTVNDGAKISILKLKERLVAPVNFYKFTDGDTNLYCTVISDEVSGNFYQQIFVRDEEGKAIQLNLKESGGLYFGDKIRINLNKLYLVSANSMIYLDSVDLAKNVVKLSSGNKVEPKHVSLDEVLSYSAMPANAASLQSQLVELSGMEFKTNTLVPTFADAIGKVSVSQTISTCEAGKIMTVRTSGRSNFAGKLLPKGNGSIIGIITQYNTSMQLTLRNYSDVIMTGPLCAAPTTTQAPGTFLVKDFNDNSIGSGGWINYAITNVSVNWSTGTSSLTPSPYGRISGYVGGNTNSETWLISPEINLESAKDPILSFKSAAKFSGTALDALISSSDYLWVPSGYVSLEAFKSATTRIAFKYKSTTAGATSYQLDDIVVKEK